MAQLTELLRFARDGDTVVVHSMDRLAGNLDDLRALVQGLTRKRVRVEFIKESLVFTGEDPHGQPHALRHGRLRRIRTLSHQGPPKGRHCPGQAARRLQRQEKTFTQERAAELVRRASNGVPKAVLARDYGISRESVYQYLRQVRLS